jgi:hypothetical protein
LPSSIDGLILYPGILRGITIGFDASDACVRCSVTRHNSIGVIVLEENRNGVVYWIVYFKNGLPTVHSVTFAQGSIVGSEVARERDCG